MDELLVMVDVEAVLYVAVIGGVIVPDDPAALVLIEHTDAVHVALEYHLAVLPLADPLRQSLIALSRYGKVARGIYIFLDKIGKSSTRPRRIAVFVHIGGTFQHRDRKI